MNIGEKLKEARHKKGLTLRDVQAELRIRSAYIEAMENNRFDLIPGEAYRRAFLRTYASFLGLDVGEIMKEYETIYGKPDYVEEVKEESKIQSYFWKTLAVIISVGILTVAIYLTIPEKPSKPELPQAPIETTQKKENPVPQKTESTETKKPESNRGPVSEFKFRIEVLENRCWVEIKDQEENKVIVATTFSPGEFFETTSASTLTVTIGYPKAVRIYINNKEFADFPKRGVIKMEVGARGVFLK